MDSRERAFLSNLFQKADQHRRWVDRIEGRMVELTRLTLSLVKATTTAIYVSTSINTAAGDVQVADVLHHWSVKFNYLREIWRIAEVRTAMSIASKSIVMRRGRSNANEEDLH